MQSVSISQSNLACDIWPSWPCHRFESCISATFMASLVLIAITGYKLLYLYPFPIFGFPQLIIHVNSLTVVQYPSFANMPIETRLLLSSGTCWSRCRVIGCWASLGYVRLRTPTRCLVRLFRWLQLNSSKIIRCWGSREMQIRNVVATFAHLVHCRGLLQLTNLLGRGFLPIGIQQH